MSDFSIYVLDGPEGDDHPADLTTQVQTAWKAGASVDEISGMLGISSSQFKSRRADGEFGHLADRRRSANPKAARRVVSDRFTDEQMALIAAKWSAGESTADIAAAVGVKSSMFNEHRSFGQLRHLPSRQGMGGGRRVGEPSPPTPREIEQATARIRAQWSPEERLERRVGGVQAERREEDATEPPRGTIPTPAGFRHYG